MENTIKKGTPKDVFLHLLAVATLYTSVIAFISLWWQYINILFPDMLQNGYYYSASYGYNDTIRWAMAALMIVFPVYILISWIIGREFVVDQEKREIRVRKWLWYITLFFSAMTMIIDLITLIFDFLKGDLSTQFFLKVIVILIVAGSVFGYYLWDLKKRDGISSKPKIVAWISSLIIVGSLVYGFFLIGSPANQRLKAFDEQRVNILSNIQNQIISYWQSKGKLPALLDDLKDSISGFVPPLDPETKMPFAYTYVGQYSFKLCATFKTSNLADYNYPTIVQDYGINNWRHDKGHICFDRTIDPQIYKPYTNPLMR